MLVVRNNKCKHHLAEWQHASPTLWCDPHYFSHQAINTSVAGQTQRLWSNITIMSLECNQASSVAWPKQNLQTSLSFSGLLLALLIPIWNSAFSLLPPEAQHGGWWTAHTRRIQELCLLTPQKEGSLPTGALKPVSTLQTLNVRTQKQNSKKRCFFVLLVY